MYLYFWGQDIHLSDCPENSQKMPTYFFQVKIWGGGV